MNFNRNGWFQRYLEFRSRVPLPDVLPSTGVRVLEEGAVHHELDQAIYYFLQPTGLLYGFPVGLPFEPIEYPEPLYLDGAGRAHLIFLDSLLACMVADRHYLLEELSEERDHFAPTVALVMEYFLERPFAAKGRAWRPLHPGTWLAGRDPHSRFEYEVRACIGQGNGYLQLPGYYYNSFLFLDLYFCMLWQRRMLVEPDGRREHLSDLGHKQLQLRELMLRMIVGAATASGRVEHNERRVIDWFFRSSALPRPLLAALRVDLARGLPWEQVQAPDMPWLVRRFILEMMLMILLVERALDDEALRFMEQVVEKLGLWNEELNQSVTALEVFMLNRGDQLQILSRRPALMNIGDTLRERAAIAVRRNLARIVQEIRETQELYSLLIKATSTPLTREEKRKVQQQLLDIVKTIPTLAIFALPGGGLILPILLRLLPFNLLPSAFED